MKSLLEDWRNLLNHQKQVGLTVTTGCLFLYLQGLYAHGKSLFILEICFTCQVYKQLAEDDRVRYKNEMMSWEEHMVEIGREDLIREKTLSRKEKTAAKRPVVKKSTNVKAKVTKTTTTGNSKKDTKTPLKTNETRQKP